MNSNKYKITYSSDLHGNKIQYEKLFKNAYDEKSNSVILGGDITPKDPKLRNIKDQKEFLTKFLFPLIKKYSLKNKKRKHEFQTFIILGNDDFRTNGKILKEYQKKIGFKYIHKKNLKLNKDFRIAGYGFVPITPFKYKDWEKPDLIKENEYQSREGFTTKGIKSTKKGFVKHTINLKNRKTSIESDLKKLVKDKNTILVCHAPPFKTRLDMISKKEHVGSEAVKKIILQKKPTLTLHGHVHETMEFSKSFYEKINETTSICSANDHLTEKIAVVEFDLYNLKKIKRRII